MQIKFSHSYPKLHGQESALLVAVELRGRSDFSEKFIEYDTAFDGGHYPLPPAQYMVLVFLGNELIPFTTVRRWTAEKFRYYHNAIGQTFEIVRVVAAKAAESAPTSTNTGMAAEAAQIAAEMNDVLQSGVLNHQAIGWVTHWARQLRHA